MTHESESKNRPGSNVLKIGEKTIRERRLKLCYELGLKLDPESPNSDKLCCYQLSSSYGSHTNKSLLHNVTL